MHPAGKDFFCSYRVPMAHGTTTLIQFPVRNISSVTVRRHHSTRISVISKKKDVLKVDDSSPFLEAFLRSIILGASVGAGCEIVYTLSKMSDFATDAALLRVGDAIPHFLETFRPWFFGDHVAAIAVFALLYTIEAVTALAVVQNGSTYPNTSPEKWGGLTKRIFPWKFTPVKLLLSKMIGIPNTGYTKVPVSSHIVTTNVPYSSAQVALERHSSPLRQVEPISKIEQRWLRRKNELVERESYLTNFWYVVALSEKVTDKPMSVQILSMKVVLFRDELGVVHCLKDVCPHRSAPLSKGWIAQRGDKKCIVCPYHGWAFDGQGNIKHIPTTDHLPKHANVDSFVVEELGGFVWLFYEHPIGSKLPAEERPPIPCIPELNHPNWRGSYSELEFDCGHWSVFENAMDLAHIHYLHADSFGNAEKPRVEDLKASKYAYGVNATCNIHNKTVNILWKFTEVDTVPVEVNIMLPSTSAMKISLGAGIEFITFVNTVPINKHKSINRFALLRNFLPWPSKVWDPWARNAMLKILSQDKAMVEKLTPELSPGDISVDVDIVQILFRRLRHDYFQMGYGFNPICED